MTPLFDGDSLQSSHERLEEGAVLLRGFAAAEGPLLVEEVERIAQGAAFRHLVTPGGYTMSVAMTNCGRVGWVSDRTGYRYDPGDPQTGAPWPPIPAAFLSIAAHAAAEPALALHAGRAGVPAAATVRGVVVGAHAGAAAGDRPRGAGRHAHRAGPIAVGRRPAAAAAAGHRRRVVPTGGGRQGEGEDEEETTGHPDPIVHRTCRRVARESPRNF